MFAERIAQIEFQRAAHLQADVHFRLEEPPDRPAIRLGEVERDIGAFQQFVIRLAIAGRDCDPDADADRQAVAFDLVRRAENLDDAAGEDRRIFRLIEAGLQNGEFVAAEAGDRVDFAHAGLQPLRHRAQQRVADRMAERIVDLLEVIEIKAQHSEATTGRGRSG